MRLRTFSAATIQALDAAVNAFVDRQTIDGRVVFRKVLDSHFLISGATFYLAVFYEESGS